MANDRGGIAPEQVRREGEQGQRGGMSGGRDPSRLPGSKHGGAQKKERGEMPDRSKGPSGNR